MATDSTLMIGAAAGLVTASAHAFVLVSKELRAWWKGDRRQARPPGRATKAPRHDH
jgi:hypothetical protein